MPSAATATSRSRSITRRPERASSAAVGSSQTTRRGSCTNARIEDLLAEFIAAALFGQEAAAFIGLAGWFMQWLSLEQEPSIWISFVASMAWLVLALRKG